ncbi:ABC transporter permease [Acidisoma cellulosilytica]|uniref:ABC transporter permease n=1 Tax=Acidisoma cellulosilyticum TaxID=2802395 RepID=A0A963YX61_9PROT|nr:ABC transporter permease [Acidisoma cellulosilyticum]MCB8878749.1 ABC transporter permease [Acidisoma cellulosilyticum]
MSKPSMVTYTAPPARAAAARLWKPGPVLLRLTVLFLLLMFLFGVLLGHRLFNGAAIRSMAFQLPELAIFSLAMMVPLLSGGLDLSIIATANLSALAAAFVFTHFGVSGSDASVLLWHIAALVAAFGVAAMVGLLNGTVIAYLGVSPILATLGTMTMVKGIAVGLTHGGVIAGFPPFMVFIGNGSILGVPVVLLVFAVIAIPMGVLLTRTPFGQRVTMLGSNLQAVRYSGIDTRRVLVRVYLLSALLSAVAGLLMMARFNSANAAYGESYLLITILAAVLGGIDPAGGFGKVSGLVMSLIVLQLVSTAANLLNVSQFLSLALWGAILLGVAGIGRVWAWARLFLPARKPS